MGRFVQKKKDKVSNIYVRVWVRIKLCRKYCVLLTVIDDESLTENVLN